MKIGNGKGDIPTLKHRKERRSKKPTTINGIIERHVPPITPIISIQKAQKTAEALNETAKTDPKTT